MPTNLTKMICRNIYADIEYENIPRLKTMILDEDLKTHWIEQPEMMYEALSLIVKDSMKGRGRPKKSGSTGLDLRRHYQNLACKVKAYILGESFSTVWEYKYLPSISRPIQTQLSVIECTRELLNPTPTNIHTNYPDYARGASYVACRLFELLRVELDAILLLAQGHEDPGLEFFVDEYFYCYNDEEHSYETSDGDYISYVCMDGRVMHDYDRYKMIFEEDNKKQLVTL